MATVVRGGNFSASARFDSYTHDDLVRILCENWDIKTMAHHVQIMHI